MSFEEFPITSPKKSTYTESIPVHVSLVVSTINQDGTMGWAIGLEVFDPVKGDIDDQRKLEPEGDVGFPPNVTLVEPQIVRVSSPASVGTFGLTLRNTVS